MKKENNKKTNNKKENIYSFKGISKVFKFTLKQTFKNKAYRVSMIMIILMLTFMGPFMMLMTGSGAKAAGGIMEAKKDSLKAEKILIVDKAGLGIDEEIKGSLYEIYGKEIDISLEDSDDLNESTIKILIEKTVKDNMPVEMYQAILADESHIRQDEADLVAETIAKDISRKKLANAGLDEDTIKSIQNGVSQGSVISETSYKEELNGEYSDTTTGMYVVQYSLIIFTVCTFAASYIIVAVNEEKASKLVETLLISVRPMALIFGKVLGTLTFIVSTLAIGMIGNVIVTEIMKKMGYIVSTATSAIRFDIITRFGPKFLILFIVSIIIAILFFGIISGLAGSSCVKPEDQQSATGTVMMIAMAGYMLSCMLPSFVDDPTIRYLIMGLVPPVNFFSNAILLATGRISAGLAIVSYAIEIVLIVSLFLLCAKTYRKLLFNDSKKLKFIEILKLAKN